MHRCLALVVVVGCGSSHERQGPPPRDVLAGATAVFDRYADGSVLVTIGPSLTCDEGSRGLQVELRSQLAPDGSRSWVLGTIYPAPNEVGRVVDTAIGSLREFSGRARVDLAFEIYAGPSNIAARGSVDAIECHREIRYVGPPAGKPQRSTATMTIAGEKHAIVGALRRGDDIELSDEPRGCEATWLTRATLARVDRVWTLSGGSFATSHRTNVRELVVTVDKGTLTLEGSATVDGYRIELAGDVDVLECPPANANPPDVRVGDRTTMPAGVDLERWHANGHTAGDDNEATIGCATVDGATWCYARASNGDRASCVAVDAISKDMIRSIPRYGYLEFEWERGSTACAGVATYQKPGDRAK